MATRAQFKAIIDAAVVTVKNDIDTVLPPTSNIVDGAITFSPTKWSVKLDAGGTMVQAEALITSIVAALTAASRSSTVQRARRADDGDRSMTIFSRTATYHIINF